MSISVTSLSSGGDTSGTPVNSVTTASVSPAAGSVVLLWVGYQASAFGNIASVSGLGGTWTNVLAQVGNTDCYLELWWTAPASSGTITITQASGVNFDSCAWDIEQAIGVSTTAPLVAANTVSASGSGGNHTVTFNQAAASGNVLVTAISWSVAGGSWTLTGGISQLADAKATATFYSEMLTAWDSSPGSATSFGMNSTVSDTAPAAGVELAAGAGWSFVGSGSDQSAGGTALNGVSAPVCTLPSGIASGDVIILDVLCYNTTVTSWPSGFTQQLDVTAAGGLPMQRFVATKLSSGSEPSTVTVTLGGTSWGDVLSYVIRGASSATPANTGSATSSSTVTALADPSLTAGSADATVWGYGGTTSAGNGTGTLSGGAASGLSNFVQETQAGGGTVTGIGWQTGNTAPGGTTSSAAIYETDWALDFTLPGSTSPSDSDAASGTDVQVMHVFDARRRV